MIDYFFKFATEAAAIADAAGSVYYTPAQADGTPGRWNADRVTPGLQVWRPSQDVIALDADGNVVSITHTFLAGWFGVVSLNRIAPALLNHAKLQLAVDRDLANAGAVGAVLQSNITPAVLQDIMFSPVFAGANYPFGNFQ